MSLSSAANASVKPSGRRACHDPCARARLPGPSTRSPGRSTPSLPDAPVAVGTGRDGGRRGERDVLRWPCLRPVPVRCRSGRVCHPHIARPAKDERYGSDGYLIGMSQKLPICSVTDGAQSCASLSDCAVWGLVGLNLIVVIDRSLSVQCLLYDDSVPSGSIAWLSGSAACDWS